MHDQGCGAALRGPAGDRAPVEAGQEGAERRVAAAAAAMRQQDRDAARELASALAVAALDPPFHVGVGFHTQFLACF